ncbi:molybdopterin oxidoreductase family protein [Agromyces seonyuensis]|uniref:Molybdopterin-dependent oxidoreductase n=1 Tax=Agromyces seonyuensis TaxID=2662446 RepID=A0A6I4P4N2_9MICO|nr:molybdopterin oxidoreductase family protein [Agromyces seonyuensis]MWB98284.1 molybdopterin-dependent oxidoreductase [Agromyces seonyuensis]
MERTSGGARTHCPYCALQCAMTLTEPASRAPGEPLLEVAGRDFPTNRGGLCKKGWTSAVVLDAPGRVTVPLVKQPDGSFAEASWDEALDLVVDRVRAAQAAGGADAVGVFGGGGLTNEKAYQLGKFARTALRTSRIDYNGRFCMSSAAAAANRAFGLDRGLPFPVTDLDAARTVLLLGSNPADTMPPFLGHLEGARAAGGLIVVDPRRSSTARLTADGVGIHLAAAPGTDLALLLGLAHLVIAEGLVDRAYVDARTSGFEALRRSVAEWWPERTAAVTGVPADRLREVVRRLAEGDAYILTGRGVEQHADGTDTAQAAINLALLLGLPGTAGSGYGTMTGQGNGQGGREHGQKADQLPGYRSIADPAARAHVAAVWGVDPDSIPGPGVPAVQLLESAGAPGGVSCLFVHGSNPVISAPNAGAVRAAFARLDTLVVCDFLLGDTAALADVVLPIAQWAEEDGTMTNLEGRVLRRRRALEPPGQARSELWILAELARRLGSAAQFDTDPETVFGELGRASAGGKADYSGIDYRMLDGDEPVHWPFPAGGTSTPRPFAERFGHPDGLAKFVPVKRRQNPETPSRPDELWLVTGRLLEHYQSGAQTRQVPELMDARPRLVATMHPTTASARGLAEGDTAVFANHRASISAPIALDAGIRPDTVFLPFHFPGGDSANLLTSDAVDPTSSMPEFKSAVVTVAKA